MKRRSQIQGYLFKLGFILFICIPQSQTFAYSILDLKRLPSGNNVELVGNLKPDFKGSIADYFSYKKYLSDLFSTTDELLANHFFCKEFLILYNQEIKARLFHSRKLFNNDIAPILNKILSLKFYHLFKTEILIYSV
jgi:hypothetical protein